MFTDEKTLNTIHADLDANVSHGTMRLQDLIPRYMDVIRDTPEYVQLLNVVPARAVEDGNAEWWNSEDAISLWKIWKTPLRTMPRRILFWCSPRRWFRLRVLENGNSNRTYCGRQKKFVVTLTMIYNATVEVEATDAKEAVEYVRDNLGALAPDSLFDKEKRPWTMQIRSNRMQY